MQINVLVKGIKCDNKKCEFIDMDVKYEDYDKWLDKPCPLCGSNLLTKKDYDYVKKLNTFSGIFNDLLKNQ